MNTINETNFQFPNQKAVYKGKVREVYNINDQLLVMIASDRLSAFDVVLPRQIPFKGQILNQIATKMMNDTEAPLGLDLLGLRACAFLGIGQCRDKKNRPAHEAI